MEILIPLWAVALVLGNLVLLVVVCFKLRSSLAKVKFQLRSQSTRYGQITEQFLPLVDSYPWDSKQFRFLGSPIDGVQFEEDRIILVEFKSSSSQISERQRKIKDLVEQGKVQFELIRAR